MIDGQQLERRFEVAGTSIRALDGLNLRVDRGEFVVIQGPSGCGKSTLLLALGGMQRPSAGRVQWNGQDLFALSARSRNRLRAQEVGFVFQLFHLVPYLNVRENILAGGFPHDASQASGLEPLMHGLGLSGRSESLPGMLSAGERQRVALARALIKRPSVILADEPTGNLDPANATEVFRHLADFQQSGGTVIVVTHGADASPFATRIIRMEKGRIVQNSNHSPTGSIPNSSV